MKQDFNRTFVTVVVLLIGLLLLERLPDLIRRGDSRRRLGKIVDQMRNGDLNREDFDALAANYYEGLRNDSTPTALPVEKDDIRVTNDFLLYGFKPNLKRRYPAGMRITNSLAMPNREYGYEKPPHTRRIAIIGDSVSVGPYGHDYGALLEEHLNQDYVTPEIQQFQILNFAVYGYGLVQEMDVALEKAPKFHPDVYMVTLTQLLVNQGWSGHIIRLILNRSDLKYDFLRQVVAQAGIQPTDHLREVSDKLAPYRLQIERWALEQIRDHAAAEGAQVVFLLLPVPIDSTIVNAEFKEIVPTIDGLGVPVINLRDAFASSRNLAELQVDPGVDIHPNARAHEILFENLYRKIQADPQLKNCIVGTSGGERQAANRESSALLVGTRP